MSLALALLNKNPYSSPCLKVRFLIQIQILVLLGSRLVLLGKLPLAFQLGKQLLFFGRSTPLAILP